MNGVRAILRSASPPIGMLRSYFEPVPHQHLIATWSPGSMAYLLEQMVAGTDPGACTCQEASQSLGTVSRMAVRRISRSPVIINTLRWRGSLTSLLASNNDLM